MATFPTFHFPGAGIQSSGAFAPAQIDFSKIGQIADSYYDAQNNRMKREAFQEQQAAARAERDRQNQVRQVFAQGLPRDAQGNIDYSAASERLLALDPNQGVDFLKMGSQEADRRHSREFDREKFNADQAYRQQQLGLQREQLAPSDVREYQFYAGQEREAGRAPKPYDEWKRTSASSSYGKSGTIVQDANGNFYSVQFGSDGNQIVKPLAFPGGAATPATVPQAGGAMVPAPPPVPLTPARGVSEVDTGTGTRIIDKATGKDVREIDKNLVEAERQKVVGKETGEGQMSLPKLERALRSYEIKDKSVNYFIDTAMKQAGPWTTGFVGNVGSFVAGTPAHDLSKTLTAIRANLGFETLQDMRDNSPTGGALGQVTEMELELLQSAWGSVLQSQSEEQLKSNLAHVKQIKAEFLQLKRDAYQQDVARFGRGNVPPLGAEPAAPPAGNGGWSLQRIE